MKREEVVEADRIWPVLGPHWQALMEETEEGSPFLSVEWMESWLSLPQDDLNRRGFLWSDDTGQVVGCAVVSIQDRRLGWFDVRTAILNATGGTEVASEHNDLLARAPYRQAIMEDLVSWQLRGEAVDEFALVGARKQLSEAVSGVWPSDGREGYSSESPFADLAEIRTSDGQYLDALSANTRGQIRRSIRLYRDRFGPPSFEIAAGADQTLRWLDTLVGLHERHWRSRGRSGGFTDGRREFHASLIRRTCRQGTGGLQVLLCRLRFGERPIGMLYLLVFRDRVYFYQSGFEYEDDNRLKPGFVTHALAIQHFLAQGFSEYDFLGGEPEPVQYKRSLATGTRYLDWVRLAAPSPKMQLIDAVRRLGRFLKSDASEFYR